MASTYVNDLRLNELGTGDGSGTWGTTTNTNLELIAEGLSFGTEAITTNADTHTSTVADGSTDPARSMFIKYTGTLDSACTITIAPNTISRVHFIENGTSGSQNIIIKQGSGATVTIAPGDVKVVYLDGAGSGAAVVDAFNSLSVATLNATDLDLDIGTGGDGIQLTSTGANYLNLGFDTNRTGASQTLTQIEQKWNGTTVGRIQFVSGADTTNKDDAEIRFQTAAAGTPSTAMSISSAGNVSTECSAGDNNFGLATYHATSTSSRTIAKFQSNVGGTQQDKVVIKCDGSVGIGTDSPDSEPLLHVRKGDAGSVDSATNSVLTIENSTTAILQFLTPNNVNQQIRFGDPQDTGAGFIQYNHTDNAIQFGTNGPEKMRITSGGKVLLNTTSTSYGGQLVARQSDGVSVAAIAAINTATSGTRRLIDFFTGTSTTRKGSIESDGTNTSYNTSSDYRLKENIADADDAGSKIDAIQVRQFDWIADGSHQDYGMIAQELQTVAPEAVSGNPDGDEMMGVDYSKLVPMLIKEVQSLRARVAELENN